jgi:hypothetical protein
MTFLIKMMTLNSVGIELPGNIPPHFEIIDKDFTTQVDIDSGTKNKDALSLNTTDERQKGLSNHDLAVTVNAALMDNLKKAEKQKTLKKIFLQKNSPT